MTSLYQLSTELRESLDNAFDPETGEALPMFEELRALWGSKARDVVSYMLNTESDAMQCKLAIARIKAMQEAHERKAQRLRDYIRENMAASGVFEIKATDGTFCAKLALGRDESVELDEGVEWPLELCNEPKPPLPSKTKIKQAIERGEAVKGARIVRKDRLTIK
jgi:hypothetical protein